MALAFAKPAKAIRKLIDMAHIGFKLVALLPPSTYFDEVGQTLPTKVLRKGLNYLAIETFLTMKGDIFNHLDCYSSADC